MSIPFHKQDGLDSRHLAIVWCRANAQQGRLRETGDGREANQSSNKQEDLLKLERLDAYKNHGNYRIYKQQPCQSAKAGLRNSAVFLARSRTKKGNRLEESAETADLVPVCYDNPRARTDGSKATRWPRELFDLIYVRRACSRRTRSRSVSVAIPLQISPKR